MRYGHGGLLFIALLNPGEQLACHLVDFQCHRLQALPQARPKDASPVFRPELRPVGEADDATAVAVQISMLAPGHRGPGHMRTGIPIAVQRSALRHHEQAVTAGAVGVETTGGAIGDFIATAQ